MIEEEEKQDVLVEPVNDDGLGGCRGIGLGLAISIIIVIAVFVLILAHWRA